MARVPALLSFVDARVVAGAWILAGLAAAAEAPSVDMTPLAVLTPTWSFMGNGGPLALPGRCDLGTDTLMSTAEAPVYSVRCTSNVLPSFGGAHRNFDLAPYRGRRVRISAELMAADITSVPNPQWPHVEGEAGLWISVVTPGEGQRTDRMQERAIRGTTDWVTRDFVVDIPANAAQLNAGYWMQGKGQVWMRNLMVEVVPATVPVNFDRNAVRPDQLPDFTLAASSNPRPEDRFLPPPKKWLAVGESNFELCDAGIDARMLSAEQRNLSIACSVPVRVYLRQAFASYPWRGKRVRLSAWIRTENVVPRTEGAGRPGVTLFLSATDTNGPLYESAVIGTTEWTYHELVADIPAGGPYIPVGISLVGTGQVWARDLKFEEVPRDTPLSAVSSPAR